MYPTLILRSKNTSVFATLSVESLSKVDIVTRNNDPVNIRLLEARRIMKLYTRLISVNNA